MSRVKHNNSGFGRQGTNRKRSVSQMTKQAIAFHELAYNLSEENKALKDRIAELERAVTSEIAVLGQEQEKLEDLNAQE